MATEERTQTRSEEIATAMATVWTRHAAKRPTDLQIEIGGNRVTCVIPHAVQDFETGPDDDRLADSTSRQATYRREAATAIAKTMRCRVLAVLSDRDAETDAATEVFILDAPAKSDAFGSAGWVAR